jgi:ribosomal protein S18 acetylase RimI-like enzyme
MRLQTRIASQDDFAHLIRVRMMAHGGFNEALYENLDQSVEAIIETELCDPGSTEYYKNYWVALEDNEIVGGLLAFPFDDQDPDSDHPLIPEDRLVLEEPFEAIGSPGSYYIHALSVFPEYARRGIGSVLLGLAGEQAVKNEISELSLYVFAENLGAISLYKKHGFQETGRRALVPHPKFIYSGDVLLMTCPILSLLNVI